MQGFTFCEKAWSPYLWDGGNDKIDQLKFIVHWVLFGSSGNWSDDTMAARQREDNDHGPLLDHVSTCYGLGKIILEATNCVK